MDEPINTTFSLKYLNHFAKGALLASRVRLSICNGVPIEVMYAIREVRGDEDEEMKGHLKFYLAPKIDDDNDMD